MRSDIRGNGTDPQNHIFLDWDPAKLLKIIQGTSIIIFEKMRTLNKKTNNSTIMKKRVPNIFGISFVKHRKS